MKRRMVLTVGNPMMGDDGAGPLLAWMMRTDPVEGWDVLDGGSAPENWVYRIRELKPEQVLLVDAADMDLRPGETRLIGPDRIDDPFLMSTHTLPLSYLVQAIGEFVPDVQLLGIQPGTVAFGYPMCPEVRQAVEQVHQSLKQDSPAWQALEPGMMNTEWKST